MSCRFDLDLLQDYVDGVTDPVEAIFIEEHLKACGDCRRETSELKLLFWDLDNKANYESELPREMDAIKNTLLEIIPGIHSTSTAGRIIRQQRKNLAASTRFIGFVPGAKQGGKLLKEGAKSIPSAVGKVTAGLARRLIAR